METESIVNCSHEDYLQILSDLEDFWGSNRTAAFHHPMFIHEFGDTAFVIRQQEKVIAYLFGFISNKDQTGYVHLIGVRENFRKKGLGKQLYEHFMEHLRHHGISEIKAITTPTNENSIRFHTKLGMTLSGNPNELGIPVVRDYSGPGQDRVVFRMLIQ